MCKSLKNPKTASSFFVPVYNSVIHIYTMQLQLCNLHYILCRHLQDLWDSLMSLMSVCHVWQNQFSASATCYRSIYLLFKFKRTNVSSSSLSHDTFDFCRKNSSISKVKQGKTIGYCVHIFPTWNMGSVPTQLANFNAQLA